MTWVSPEIQFFSPFFSFREHGRANALSTQGVTLVGDSSAITCSPQMSPPASSFLQSSTLRALRALSFEQANARCHTQEGYCKGKQPARRNFTFFFFSFTLFSLLSASPIS